MNNFGYAGPAPAHEGPIEYKLVVRETLASDYIESMYKSLKATGAVVTNDTESVEVTQDGVMLLRAFRVQGCRWVVRRANGLFPTDRVPFGAQCMIKETFKRLGGIDRVGLSGVVTIAETQAQRPEVQHA